MLIGQNLPQIKCKLIESKERNKLSAADDDVPKDLKSESAPLEHDSVLGNSAEMIEASLDDLDRIEFQMHQLAQLLHSYLSKLEVQRTGEEVEDEESFLLLLKATGLAMAHVKFIAAQPPNTALANCRVLPSSAERVATASSDDSSWVSQILRSRPLVQMEQLLQRCFVRRPAKRDASLSTASGVNGRSAGGYYTQSNEEEELLKRLDDLLKFAKQQSNYFTTIRSSATTESSTVRENQLKSSVDAETQKILLDRIKNASNTIYLSNL